MPLDLASSADHANRPAIVRAAHRTVDRMAAEQQTKLAAALAQLGVDWSAVPANTTGAAQLAAAFSLDAAGKVRAGDVVKITGSVTNRGAAPAFQVMARLKSEDRVFDETELLFGKIDPGQTRTWTTAIR